MSPGTPARVRAVLAGVALGGAACGATQPAVEIEATVGGIPLEGLEIVALPFDPDRLLDSLEALAPAPRPRFPALEDELAGFVPPHERAITAATAGWRALRDSVAALADSLHRMDRRTAAYASLYGRFRDLYDRLAERTVHRDRALRELAGPDRVLADRARAAAESLRTWERTAFAGFDAAAEAATIRAGRPAHEAVTDRTGRVHLELEPGRWWLVARLTDPRNPFRERYWNQPLAVASWLPLRVPLTEQTAQPRWRH